MANYLASIFGTEQDKVSPLLSLNRARKLTLSAGQLLLLLQNRRLSTWRPLFAQTRETFLQPDRPPAEPVPKSSIRPEEQAERIADAESL